MQRTATIELRTSLYDDATAIVADEYGSDLSLDDIARRVASSRRQLQRAYKEIGDTTFREHLTGVRMDRAADLLSSRSLTVRDVARRVGYRQPAQFAKRSGAITGPPRRRTAPSGWGAAWPPSDRDAAAPLGIHREGQIGCRSMRGERAPRVCHCA